MNYLLFYCIILSFLVVVLVVPSWINRAKKAGLTGKDIHKINQKEVAEMGGIIVLLGFIIGTLSYIAVKIFFFQTSAELTPIFAILTAICIAGIIGIIDDILGWKIGLKQWQKPLLTLLIVAPIMALGSGNSMVLLVQSFGKINIGLVYPLLIIPVLILVGTNGFNMLAGYNGLEAGQGIIILSTLAYLSFATGSGWLAIVALCMVFALIGFWFYNRFPAKVFPGDTLTYSVGAFIAIVAIMGDFERAFVVLFIPYIIEFLLKFSGGFKKESFALVISNGTLIPRYRKTYGLENLAVKLMNKLGVKTTEKRVVWSIHAFQLVFVIITLYLYG